MSASLSRRLDALRRVLKVQDGLERAAEWRFAEAERAAAVVETARADLSRFVGEALPTGPLAAAADAQARRLALRAAAAAETAAAEAGARREVAARRKLLERAVDALARDEAAARERKDLERLVEGFAARAIGGAPPEV